MRSMMFAAALILAGCSGEVGTETDAGGYRLEVRAADGETTYLVTALDGKSAAALVSGGSSTLLEENAVRALAEMPAPAAPSDDNSVTMRAPGFSLTASGDEDDEGGQVAINVAGRNIQVDAQEGPGTEDRAHVLISGVNADDARDFINEAEDISAEVKTQMLAELGL